ncbi:periplasmic heavy metal sensor [Phenylobacterium sp.]|uniref:periplasmic heavy metal sensor n=1 Tax=Phenylobacterium sp. TaxID=1871053 RepID=UPI0028989031|nr:periplasmic heavy metal sensor [Phenylobacterium sp.]
MSRKALFVMLFVSLAVNLFLVGALAGGLVVGQRFRADRPPMASRPVQPLWRAGDVLPPDRAQAYRQALRDEAPGMRETMRAARAARQDAWRAIGQDPFDPVATKRRLAEIRAQEAGARGQIDDNVVDFAAGLSPADRAALARGLTERPRGPSPQEGRRER